MDVKIKVQKVKLWPIALCLLLIGLISCKEKKVEKIPSNILGKDTMVQILTEMHLIESSLGIRIFEDKKIIHTRNVIKAKVYQQYGVSKDRFFNSYNYYSQNSAAIDTIYADVISEITKRQAQQLKK